ncbi:MAG: DUF3048 domain-containing protein [Candidatus Kerfeldbacteria bacterium]|nr:DUF3048 domain-containing protein [Candidatus Kerfeldbacteria bacterium]
MASKTKKPKSSPEPLQPEPEEDILPAPASDPKPEVHSDQPAQPASPTQPKVVKTPGPKPKRVIPVWAWVAIGIIVLGGAAALGFMFNRPTTTDTTNQPLNQNTNTTQLVPRLLDGVLVPPDQAKSNTYAVMIENEISSRPPSALDKASVVYSALAEGGITRFMALYPVGGEKLAQIGPVRSARPYFITEAEEYKALYVHAGGSPQALSYLKSSKSNVVDFNQFSHGGNFIRDDSRAAPHNLYTDSDKLFLGLKQMAPNLTPTYTSWTFKDEAAFDTRPTTVNDIVINYSAFNYKVKYTYDRVQNRYQRFQADKAHVTRQGDQIYAKDVIVEFVKTGLIPGEKQRLQMELVGTGRMLLFRDGAAIEGTWKKDSNTGRTQFLDKDGNTLALNPGPIWIELVPTDRTVTY